MNNPKYRYIYGPVPSRRLGLSLGVDIIPLKTCTQNCIYCQLCVDAQQITQRQEFAPIDDVMQEVRRKLDEQPVIDCITICGSGEPTLHRSIGRLIETLKATTDKQVVVITNGTLLWQQDVRRDLALADMVMPSLDGCDEETFQKINAPADGLSFAKHIEGLIQFRKEYKGKIWLEIFMVEGLNTEPQHLEKFKALIDRINPDSVQLNTAVRPTTAADVKIMQQEKLEEIAAFLGEKTEVIAKFSRKTTGGDESSLIEKVINTIKRRPCSAGQLAESLGVDKEQIDEQLQLLLTKNIARRDLRDGEEFFMIIQT